MTKENEIKVKGHLRRKQGGKRPTVKVKSYTRRRIDPEDGTGVEIPTIAPQAGAVGSGIIDVPRPGEKRVEQRTGVTIIGGGAPKQTEIVRGVNRLGGK